MCQTLNVLAYNLAMLSYIFWLCYLNEMAMGPIQPTHYYNKVVLVMNA